MVRSVILGIMTTGCKLDSSYLHSDGESIAVDINLDTTFHECGFCSNNFLFTTTNANNDTQSIHSALTSNNNTLLLTVG